MNAIAAEEIIKRGRAAQRSWGALSVRARAKALSELRRQIAGERERIVDAIVNDTGKPHLDALSGDVLVTLEHMRYYQRHAPRILRARSVGKSRILYMGTTFREQFEPHGVALIYGPANYPFQLAMVPAVTALYAGNAVLLKVSDRTPSVARVIDGLSRASGLPPDLLQVLCEGPGQAGDYIDAQPDIVFFTGSSANGRKVAARAAARLIPAVLELGGKDAAIVFADCNLERTIEGVTYGAFSNAGQVCIGIKRLYVEEPVYELFLERLMQRISELRVGTGVDFDMGELRGMEARRLLTAQVHQAMEGGATLRTPAPNGLLGDHPIVLTDVPRDARLFQEESFGPVLCVSSFSSERQAIELANGNPFALGASIWSADTARARRVASAVSAGCCAINDVIRNIGNPGAAFGGNAGSGYGRYHGPHGLLAFSRIKSVMTAPVSRPREINWFPFTRRTYDALNVLLDLRHRPGSIFATLRRVARRILLLTVACQATGLAAGGNGHLWINVELPSGARGAIGYLVFKSPDGFPQDRNKAIAHGFFSRSDTGQFARIDVGQLSPGSYAVTAYLDENGNRKLDSGWMGIPKEPVGASNNPKPRMGPPRFADCAFQMGGADQTVSIRLEMPR
jgi:acyl-CoA reductase-like NAD-dependent aldehyde dehydrogenase/uncharacterized protein (DUF2141 family)